MSCLFLSAWPCAALRNVPTALAVPIGTDWTGAASKPSMSRSQTRVAIWVAGLLIVALALGAALQWALSHRALSNTIPPGRLVDIGGHQLHLLCQGERAPTVILEPGLPGSSLSWESVTADIAKFTRVCTYDRAGYAWSETGPAPRTTDSIAQELRLLVQNAAIEPPYVLVGHSFGGLVVQRFAGRFPSEVAGMVLVDAAHPDQVSQTVELDSATALGRAIGLLAPTGIPRFFFPVPAGSPESRDPPVLRREKQMLKTTRSLRAIAAELAGLPESLQQVKADPPNLGRKPLIVLTEGRRRAEFWHAKQEDLTQLSEASDWRIIEDAGHFIHHDQPDLVVDAVRDVLEQLRAGAM